MADIISQFSAKALKDRNKKDGIFHTSEQLAKYVAQFIPNDINEVYDPTCGAGGLLAVFGDNVRKYGQEKYNDIAEYAKSNLTNCDIVCGDTLVNPAFVGKKFRGIVANPPFSIPWNPTNDDDRFNVVDALAPKSKADYAFLLHILHYLSDDGVASCIMFPGILYRGNSEGKIRQWFVDNNYIDRVEMLPADMFDDTTINTCLVVLRKNKKNTNVVFKDEQGKDAIVSYDDIKKNNYSLSVSNYVVHEQPDKWEGFDPTENMSKIIDNDLNIIKSSIELAKLTFDLEGIDLLKTKLLQIRQFIDDEIKELNANDIEQLNLF